MNIIFKITIVCYILLTITLVNKNSKYILLFPLILLITPTFSIINDIFNVGGLTLVLQIIIIIIVLIMLLLNNMTNILRNIRYHKDIIFLIIIQIVCIISAIVMDSRINIREDLLPSLFHLILVYLVLRYYFNEVDNDRIYFFLRLNRMILSLTLIFFSIPMLQSILSGTFEWHADLRFLNRDIKINYVSTCINVFLVIELTLYSIRRKFNYLIIILLLIFQMLTASRAGILGTCMIFVMSLIKTRIKKNQVVFTLVVLIVMLAMIPTVITERFKEITEIGIIDFPRTKLILRAIYLFIDNPFFGIGVGNYYLYRYTYAEVALPTYMDSHNYYAQIAAEIGILGLVLVLIYHLYIYNNIKVFKTHDAISKFSLILFLLFIMHNMQSDIKVEYVLMIPLLAISWAGGEFRAIEK